MVNDGRSVRQIGKSTSQLFEVRSGEFRYRFKESRESAGLINGRNIHVFDGN